MQRERKHYITRKAMQQDCRFMAIPQKKTEEVQPKLPPQVIAEVFPSEEVLPTPPPKVCSIYTTNTYEQR